MSPNRRDHSERVDCGTPRSRRRFLGMAGVAAGLSGCTSPTGDEPIGNGDPDEPRPDDLIADGPAVRLEPIADGLTYPTSLADPDDGTDRLFVTDQVGTVHLIDDGSDDEPVLDIRDRVVDLGVRGGFDERGLLGIALHPDFTENGRLFLRYSAPSRDETPDRYFHVEVLSEFRYDGADDRIDPDSERILFELPQLDFNHNSGNVLFGPDGYLYVPMGDGGGEFDERPNDWYDENPGGTAQNTTDTLLGGILRLDVDADEEPYGIPPDNPLVDEPDHYDEYYAWGFRNPWGTSFDGEDLYVADVGALLFETVNRVEEGGNYGWSVREGTHCFDPDSLIDPPEDCPDETPADVRGGEPLRDPIVEYPQDYDGEKIGSAVIGGGVYRGGAVPELEGGYVFGDWSAEPHGDPLGTLFVAFPPDEEQRRHEYYAERDLWPIQWLEVHGEGDVTSDGELRRYVSAIEPDADGGLYVLTTETPDVAGDTGEIHRIVPSDAGQ